MKLPKDWKYDVLYGLHTFNFFYYLYIFGSLFRTQNVRNIYFYEETNPRKITVL